ncbi:hypothetical protein F3I62_13590 [Pseudomonas sp. R-28-1W-6]|uniref:glycosyltransferase family 9 protein n=1 Tax=Pseudomonas sp. R-28-1W-6 TaxID=2650101 RepID=UPI0013664D91|nr:glycosyltransferase family 9 protein [Pseudomonas sp. R-28-1W-6]MWV13134.1 hypothetical protein [Pseudomonas sp. R-28-1W-6]
MDDVQNLAGKRVLFIAPMFFGYEKLIKVELEAKGAQVDYFNDRPDNSFWTKALIRLDRRLLARKTDAYYHSIIESTRGKTYDHILIVRGEAISLQMLRLLRQAQPKARLSLYLWDSMHYNPNARKLLGEFNQVFSFDRSDVEQSSKMQFLPLFYGREFERSAQWQGVPVYDACFIGTIHTDRYKVLEKVIDSLQARGCKVFVFCYYPSKQLYRLRAFVDPGFRRFGRKYVNFTGMKLSEVVDRIAESRAVIDVNRPDQLGLTMRTIEAVGAQRKLITTNADVVNYDLYNPTGVLVLDRQSPLIDGDLLYREELPFDPALREKYSVSAWIDRIFNESGATII